MTQRQFSFPIAGRVIGHGHPVYVIAEIGIIHSGSAAFGAEMIAASAIPARRLPSVMMI